MAVIGAQLGALGKLVARTALRLSDEGELPSFGGANGWLNSPPLTPAGLRGKVVLVNFWTYTCVNWLRTLPYVRAWNEKYRNEGLVVIGVHTPEFPFEKNVDNFVVANAADKPHSYTVPAQLALNQWAFSGDWTITARTAVPNHPGGTLAYRFHARDLNCVVSPGQSPARIRVRIDGQPPGAAHGSDSDEHGNAILSEQRTYQLVRQQHPITDRTCTIEFLDPGVEVYCFSFG